MIGKDRYQIHDNANDDRNLEKYFVQFVIPPLLFFRNYNKTRWKAGTVTLHDAILFKHFIA